MHVGKKKKLATWLTLPAVGNPCFCIVIITLVIGIRIVIIVTLMSSIKTVIIIVITYGRSNQLLITDCIIHTEMEKAHKIAEIDVLALL